MFFRNLIFSIEIFSLTYIFTFSLTFSDNFLLWYSLFENPAGRRGKFCLLCAREGRGWAGRRRMDQKHPVSLPPLPTLPPYSPPEVGMQPSVATAPPQPNVSQYTVSGKSQRFLMSEIFFFGTFRFKLSLM